MKQVLKKLERGERIKVSVIGGSGVLAPLTADATTALMPPMRAVSTGHGDLNGHPFRYRAISQTYDKVFMNWVNSTYGNQSFISGAMPATGARFFSYCWPATTRLEEEAPDLVLVELNINDPP